MDIDIVNLKSGEIVTLNREELRQLLLDGVVLYNTKYQCYVYQEKDRYKVFLLKLKSKLESKRLFDDKRKFIKDKNEDFYNLLKDNDALDDWIFNVESNLKSGETIQKLISRLYPTNWTIGLFAWGKNYDKWKDIHQKWIAIFIKSLNPDYAVNLKTFENFEEDWDIEEHQQSNYHYCEILYDNIQTDPCYIVDEGNKITKILRAYDEYVFKEFIGISK